MSIPFGLDAKPVATLVTQIGLFWALPRNTSAQAHATVLFDACPGPNCVPEGQKFSNPAQSLLEIEATFVSVPVWLKAAISGVLFVIVVAYLFMAYYVYQKNDNVEERPNLKE